MSDDEFLAQLRDGSLPPAQFNHRGHMRLAALCLRRYGVDEAVGVACAAIGAYAASLGAADKFHWTATEALMRLMHAGRALEGDAQALLACHYSAPLLASERARRGFVAPDLAPLPAC
jgi:hypothetical protein